MIIRFAVELPFALKKECMEELRKIIKEEVSRAIQAYGVFEVVAKVKPRGVKEPSEEEDDTFERRRYWFEEAMEGR
jgi:hypothetical protein